MRSLALLILALVTGAAAAPADDWFDRFRETASDDDLLRFLHAMPKGGDLHHHLSGSIHPEWYLELAAEAEAAGWRFYTKTHIDNCRGADDGFGPDRYLLLYRTIDERRFRTLPECERGEYEPLLELDDATRAAWLDSLRLDAPDEGREEFFEAHWARIGDLLASPEIVEEMLVRDMQALGAEGVRYLEAQVPLFSVREPNGTPIEAAAMLARLRERLDRPDARATGVTVRFQLSVLRFLPIAEAMLARRYALAVRHPEIVAVNLVGREDDDRGHVLRFLDDFRALRRTEGDLPLSLHAGEVDAPGRQVRDALLAGADRIGHGLNLISDAETMLRMKDGPWLVEINLISNRLLGYVDDYAHHPFPEYLRFGIPVALSTDDRGMWNSTLTDEFLVAVREFDLSWAEIVMLSRNSIDFAFAEPAVRARLRRELDADLAAFVEGFRAGGLDAVATGEPRREGFVCRFYALCAAAVSR